MVCCSAFGGGGPAAGAAGRDAVSRDIFLFPPKISWFPPYLSPFYFKYVFPAILDPVLRSDIFICCCSLQPKPTPTPWRSQHLNTGTSLSRDTKLLLGDDRNLFDYVHMSSTYKSIMRINLILMTDRMQDTTPHHREDTK